MIPIPTNVFVHQIFHIMMELDVLHAMIHISGMLTLSHVKLVQKPSFGIMIQENVFAQVQLHLFKMEDVLHVPILIIGILIQINVLPVQKPTFGIATP